MILTILFPENTDIHYIGGADVLPAPLELEEENRTIININIKLRLSIIRID